MKKTIFTLMLVAWQTGFVAQAQQPEEIAEGYYTMSPFSLSGKEYVFSYDTDASRSPYGNASDYDNPCGKNGEVAYLYAVPSAGTPLVNSAYYFKPLGNGTYSVQSLSGEAYSYLSVAEYDRRLLIHTPQFGKAFSIKSRCKDGSSQWGEKEYTVRQYKYAGLCDTLSSASNGYETMMVLTRVEDSRITPTMSIRRPLSDAKGALAVYKVGDNPGEVSAMVAYGLTQLVDEAQTLVDDKSTTEEQAADMTARLREATRQYLEAAPTAMRPVEDGYYFVVNAYRAFLMRQKKEKTLSATLSDGERTLTWRDISVNDGGVAFHITPSGDGTFEMASYDRSLVLDDMLVNYDAEGTWTIASSADPEALMTAANQTKSLRALYGKNTADSIAFDREGHLFSGYTASWYLRKAYHQVTVPSTGWAVLSTSFPVELNDSVEAYTVSEKDGSLYMKPLSYVVPARTAVLIHAAKGTYTLPSTTKNAPAVDDNLLVAVNEPLKGIKSGTIRVLKIVSGQVGFSKSSSTSMVAGSAYLPYNEGEDDFRPFVDVEDGLSSVRTGALESGTQAYDLMGRKVDASRQKKNDIYIINNKKILKR